MKLIRAVIRPEREEAVLKELEAVGLYAVTQFPVLGRGRQRGIQVGAVSYDSLSKTMFLLAVEEKDYPKAVEAIEKGGATGHPGDGKIFVQPIHRMVTIRTGETEKEKK